MGEWVVCWYGGVLVWWCVGVLVCWRVGVFMCWCVGVLDDQEMRASARKAWVMAGVGCVTMPPLVAERRNLIESDRDMQVLAAMTYNCETARDILNAAALT